MNAPKEFLQPFEIRFAFDPSQRFGPTGPRVMPALRDDRGSCSHIVGPEQLEPRLPDEAFVLAGRQKKVSADRTASRDLLVREQSGYYQRVCEQHLPARLQHTEPFPENVRTPRHVAQGVIGQDGIEGIRREGQRSARVRQLEPGSRLELLSAGELVGVADAVLVYVQSGDPAADR